MSPCREAPADRPAQLVNELCQLRLGGVEGGRHNDRVALDAADVARAGIDDEPLLERTAADRLTQTPFCREWLLGRTIVDQLDPDQVAPAAHVPPCVESRESLPELTLQRLTARLDAGHQRLTFDNALHGEPRRARRGVARVGVAGEYRPLRRDDRLRDSPADDRRRKRDVAAGEPLADRQDVRDDT